MNIDRRDIAPLLLTFFPSMKDATSEDWHVFLNAQTGLDVSLDEENGSAFDKWRQALAGQGLPVWGVTDSQAEAMRRRGEVLKAREAKRKSEEEATLEKLNAEAPDVTAQEILERAKA